MLIFGGIVGLVIIAILIEAYLKRGKYRPLAAGIDFERNDTQSRELGTEEIDYDLVNSTIRRNNNGGLGNSTREVKQKQKYKDLKPKPFADDAHYARRWLAAFGPTEKDKE